MEEPLVTIIIRTCNRPQVLQKALISIREQNYKNIEVVIIEDGDNFSEELVRQQFKDLNIVYYYTGARTGRCHAGNIGLGMAKGQYLNFLDDDDILLPQHVESLVQQLSNTNLKAAYAIAEEHQIQMLDENKYIFQVKRKLVRYKQPFNKLLLFYMNYIPIQSIMFSRELYEELGGFDEKLDVLEDWDLWVRYATISDFLYVPAVTSVYYTPYKSVKKKKREIDLKKATDTVIDKFSQYQVDIDVNQINRDMDYILNVFNKKSVWFYLQKVRNYLLYRDI